ncbi:hypothetical protein T05_6381 [Trichinella murrelli]|uniref:Uncharacterized protein n=1 Tax=Trichinella murrelli TaxID=144512 RepID=A0A0V0TAF1_9BILA|nr:hypothetical protein T05_6381 [Trichinella murrelli]
MAFHDKTLEMQLQLEAKLTGEERDQEAKHWVALSERTQIARREARARIRQMEGFLSDCSASSNDLGPCSNSKTSVKERLNMFLMVQPTEMGLQNLHRISDRNSINGALHLPFRAKGI